MDRGGGTEHVGDTQEANAVVHEHPSHGLKKSVAPALVSSLCHYFFGWTLEHALGEEIVRWLWFGPS